MLKTIRGVTSHGAQGRQACLRRHVAWVQHQRCVWHLWRNLGGPLSRAASQAAAGLGGEAAEQARQQARAELTTLIHKIMDVLSGDQAEAALAALQGHPLGTAIATLANERFDRVLVHLVTITRACRAPPPEWYGRNFRFRLRLGHGRNHCSDQRLERAALLRALFRNFEPAQARSADLSAIRTADRGRAAGNHRAHFTVNAHPFMPAAVVDGQRGRLRRAAPGEGKQG